MIKAAAKNIWDWRIRMSYWLGIAQTVRGVSVDDQRVLKRAILKSPLTSAQNLGRWQDPIVPEDIEVTVKGVARFRVRANTDDLWHVAPGREPALLDCFRRALKPGDVFVDAGANIGFYSVLCSGLVGPTGQVVAIEMMPDTALILRDHIALNSCANVAVAEVALASMVGLSVTAFVPDGQSGQATIAQNRRVKTGKEITVTTTTLDALLTETPRIRLIKMDLEGVEADVVRGANDVLKRTDMIVFEHRGKGLETVELLTAAGFRIQSLDRANGLAVRQK